MSKLTLIREVDPIVKQGVNRLRRRRAAIYQCICGSEKVYVMEQVSSGHTKQCNSCAITARSIAKVTHGKTNHPLYRKWQDMKNRCYNKKVDRYKSYGAKGITVCEEWIDDFTAFYKWCLENKWEVGLEIDRKEVTGNYSPENCQITTHEENGFNKTTTLYVEFKDQQICFAKLMKQLGVDKDYHKVYYRHFKKGEPLIDIIDRYSVKKKAA